MGHLVCCEYAGTRHSEPVCGRQLGWGGSLTCSGQTRPVVFQLLGRAPKFPRVASGVLGGDEAGALSRPGDLPSNRTAPL